MPIHARFRRVALLLLIVFSNEFTPSRAEPFLNDCQLVWTVNVAETVRPLVCPVACTVWAPGCVDLGTTTAREKVPELVALAEPRAAESSVTLTVSPEENPVPVAVALVVGGPTEGETATDAAKEKVDDAKMAMKTNTPIRE